MSKKQIGAALAALILAVAAPLLTLALLHGAGGTARADAPPPSFTKDSVPDLGQHSTGWCWVGAAANSFWWYAYHGYPSLLGGGSAPYPWEATEPLSQQVASACLGGGAGTSLYDANDLLQGWPPAPPPPPPPSIPGYRQVMSKIAQTTFMDTNQDGQRQSATENNYCYSQGVEEWDYLVGLGTYVNSYGSGLKVHSIIDPARCLGPGPWGMKPDDRLFPPAKNAFNPCGLDGFPDAEFAFDQAPGPPTFLDYQRELSGGQDVLLWMETYGSQLETAHVVTGVGYDTLALPKPTITISDPWTHSACPDHDDCWPLIPRPDGQMPDHNNDPTHDTVPAPYNVCDVTSAAPLVISCNGTIWTVPDMIFVSPATGADIKVLTFSSEPEPPFEFTVSENNVINLVEDKHNNGPQNAWVDVSWTVDPIPDLNHDGIPDINVRWEALVGDRCTSGGLPVPCGEGDSGGSGQGNPSLTGDNCQDDIDNDGDAGLPGGGCDIDGCPGIPTPDPECLWELDDIHFQIWLPVSATPEVNRSLKLHCAVPGDYTVTLNNDEMPVEMEDPDLTNNSRTLDLPITCLAAAADKEVIDVEFSHPTGLPIDPPEMTILKSQDYTISVTSVEYNNGPDQPTDAEISFYANIPAGCEGQWVLDPANYADVLTVDGNPSIPSSGTITNPGMVAGLRTVDLHFQTLEYGIDEPPQSMLDFTRDFQLHCLGAPDVPYVFTFCNRADVKAPDEDPIPGNNLHCEDLYVTSLHNADIKILDWSAPERADGYVDVPFQITADEVKHNNGPQSAWSDVTWTAQEPVGGQVSARWIAQTGDNQPSDEVLDFYVDLEETSVSLAVSRNLELTCNTVGGPYTVTLINDEWPVDPNPPHDPWEDPVPGNNTDTTHVDVYCKQAAGQADVKVLDFWADPPWVYITEPYVWWQPIPVWEVKHNNGPDDTWADVDWWVTGGWPQNPVDVRWLYQLGDVCTFQGQPVDCEVGGMNGDIDDLHFQVWLPVSSQVQLMRGIQFECKDMGVFVLTLWNQEYPVEPIVDPDPSNNLQSTDVTVYCGVGPYEADKQVLAVGWDISTSDRNTTDPDLDIWTSENRSFTVYSLDQNLGPLPTDTTITFLANVPVGCEGRWVATTGDTLHEYERYDPTNPISQIHGYAHRPARVPGDGDPMYPPMRSAESALHFQAWEDPIPVPTPYTRSFELRCDVDGAHTFTFCNKAEVMAPNIDPITANNWQCANLTVTSADCSPLLDTDGDTFKDDLECYVATDQSDNCPDVVGADDAWPLDLDMNKIITVAGDVLYYRGRIGAHGPPSPTPDWQQRLDINKDNWITVAGDVLMFRGKISATCT